MTLKTRSLKHTFDRVKTLLEKDDKYKDSDEILIAYIRCEDVYKLGLNPYKINAIKFLELSVEKKLTSADTITRARRKCNEMHEHTRGESYKPRKHQQDQVKIELESING